jgi:hypothetical protein
MQYQTGSATSPVDLLQQLVTWLVGIGWTQDRSAVEGSGWTASLHKSGNYAHLRATMNESPVWQTSQATGGTYVLNLYLGTGYNGANAWNNQAGGPVGSSSNPIGVCARLSSGPFGNYYFFADAAGDNVVVVVQVTPGLYTYLGWGLSLNKAGSWTGGPYFFGSTSSMYSTEVTSSPNLAGFTITADCPFVGLDARGGAMGFVRVDVDSFTGKWVGIHTSAVSAADHGYQGKRGNSSIRGLTTSMENYYPVYAYDAYLFEFQNEQVSAQDGRANLLPIFLWANRDSTSTGFSLLGSVPNVFVSNAVGNGFSSADEYVLGGTTYKLFPNFAIVKQ